MSRTVLGFAAAAFIAVMTTTLAAADDRADIERIERELVEVTDPAKLSAFFAPGAQPTLYEGLAPGIYHGNEAIVNAYAPQLAGIASITSDLIELTIDVAGDLGTAYCVHRVTAVTKSGERRHVTFRETDIFKRIGGRWLIVHQHVSYPVDPSTGKAVFDLDPRARGTQKTQ